MLVKALVGTAKDLWQRRLLPAQVRAKDTRLAFAEIIVRHELICLCVMDLWTQCVAHVCARASSLSRWLQGDESLKGMMVPTGPILGLMDVLAGSIALRYVRRIYTLAC